MTNQELLAELKAKLPKFTPDEYKTLVSLLALDDWGKPLILYLRPKNRTN